MEGCAHKLTLEGLDFSLWGQWQSVEEVQSREWMRRELDRYPERNGSRLMQQIYFITTPTSMIRDPYSGLIFVVSHHAIMVCNPFDFGPAFPTSAVQPDFVSNNPTLPSFILKMKST